MNFMETPLAEVVSNPDYSETEVTITKNFVNDLIKLKVIEIHNCYPMFIVPKAGQPGQYRVTADGKAEFRIIPALRTRVS